MANSSDRPKRQVKIPSFETDPETQVERSIRHEHRNTLFVFIYEKACVSTGLNSIAWPRGYSDEAKLALQPGEYEFIRHNRDPRRMLYLGRGPAERVREYKKQAAEIYKKGQRPPFLWEGPGTTSATQPAATHVVDSPDLLYSSPEPTEATQKEMPQTCPEKSLGPAKARAKVTEKSVCPTKAVAEPNKETRSLLFLPKATTAADKSEVCCFVVEKWRKFLLSLFNPLIGKSYQTIG